MMEVSGFFLIWFYQCTGAHVHIGIMPYNLETSQCPITTRCMFAMFYQSLLHAHPEQGCEGGNANKMKEQKAVE